MDTELLLGGPGPVLGLDHVRVLGAQPLGPGLPLHLEPEVVLGVARPEAAECDRHDGHHQDHHQRQVETFLITPIFVDVEHTLWVACLIL